MKKILFCVCLAGILTACASQQTVPGVEIEGLEINPRTKRTKTKTYGTELQTEELNKAFKRDQTPETQTKTEPRSPEVSGDLAKFLELEIALQRDPENEDTLAEMMDYARKYRDPSMASRALEVAINLRRSTDALAAAQLWAELDPTSRDAQNAYIREIITQSQYQRAFDLMARRYDRGLRVDFRPIASFITPQSERQLRMLITTYDQYLRSYPQLRENLKAGQQIARYRLAEFLFYNEELDRSLRVLNLLLSEVPDGAHGVRQQAVNLKGRIYYLVKQPSGDVYYEQEIRKVQENRLLKVYYALYLIDQQRADSAERLLAGMLNKNTDEETVYLLGAIARYKKLAKLTSTTARYYMNLAQKNNLGYMRLGLLAMNNGEYQRAENFFIRVEEDSQLWQQTQWFRLQNIILTGDLSADTGILETLYTKDRDLYLYLVGRYVNALAKEGLRGQALRVMRQAEELLPLEKDLLLSKAYMYYELNEANQMIKVFEAAMKVDSNDATILNGYGYALVDKNMRIQKATGLIRKALAIQPTSSAYTDSLGWAYYRSGKLDRARELLTWAYRRSPDGEIAAHLGEVIWTQGQREQAKYIWLQAYELNPYSAPLLQTLRRFNIDARNINPDIGALRPRY